VNEVFGRGDLAPASNQVDSANADWAWNSSPAASLGTRFMLFSFAPATLAWVHTARTTAADQRDEWLQQEVSCLLCGRLIARLVYPIRASNGADQREPFVAARPSAAELRNLRCAACGGSAVFDIAERVWLRQSPG